MNRILKNVIAIFLIIAVAVGMFFTMKYLSNTSSSMSVPGQNENMGPGNNSQGEPPEKPSGNSTSQNESQDSSNNQSTPPEMPSGESNQGTPPDMNQESSNNTLFYVLIIVEGLAEGALITYLLMTKFNKKNFKEAMISNDKIIISVLSTLLISVIISFFGINFAGKATNKTSNQMPNGNSNSMSVSYSAKEEITEDKTITSGNYSSTTADENAISASGDIDVDISDVTVSKTGDSDGGDNTSFYGTNSAIIAKDGATLTLKNITVKTDATGANGVFSYGGSATTNNSSSDGTTVNISDSIITTTKDNSGGIMTTGGGTMNATNLTINTSGISSAAIRSDRGGGNVLVDKGTYTTTGQGSPTIYSTANIKVQNATLISKASEGVVIEGKNSVELDNVELTDSNTKLNGQSTTYKNIFLYQSMSGDASEGEATFLSKNSKIVTNNGDTLYVTNTTASITLENNEIINNDSNGNFLRIQKDSWGNSGSNGGSVTLKMKNQKAEGNIVVDSISILNMSLTDSSYFEGNINKDNTAKEITLKLDSKSKIKLTSDSYVTSLENEDTSNSNIDFNGYKLYVNGKAIN